MEGIKDAFRTTPFLTLGGGGPPLLFLHANGYPPDCYRPLITRLSEQYQVRSMLQRPLWPDSRPEEISDWNPLTDDFIRFLEEQKLGPSICVGHSVGGIVALRAALHRPELFCALILIDPVLFPPLVIRLWQVIRFLGLTYLVHPLVRATRSRRQHFNDLERLYQGYRRKSIFRFMSDNELRAYVEGISCPETQGYRLCYSVDWEMRIYVTSVWHDLDIWHELPGLKIPLMIIRGDQSDTFWKFTSLRVQRLVPAVKIATIPQATHLVALERPGEVYQAIQKFLQEKL